jgi:hypothetical protein
MHRSAQSVEHVDANQLLADLSMRQYLRPHASLREALAASAEAVGFCPRAADAAMRWLDSDPSRSIGRLRRTELTQLANSIHRFWRHAMAMETRTA